MTLTVHAPRLIYESTTPEDLENTDNLVAVRRTGDGSCKSWRRPLVRTRRDPQGAIYDLAETLLTWTDFCGSSFSLDERVFCLTSRANTSTWPPD